MSVGIYQAEHRTGAQAAFRQFKQRWSGSHADLVANTEEDIGNLLAFLDCPELHREYVRTSNPEDKYPSGVCGAAPLPLRLRSVRQPPIVRPIGR